MEEKQLVNEKIIVTQDLMSTVMLKVESSQGWSGLALVH